MRDSGVVHQDVHVPVLKNLVEHSFYVALLGHVAAIGFCIAPGSDDFAGNRLGGILVDIQDPDTGATAGKSMGDGAPDSTRSSSNHGKFAIKPKIV
jgi:hypothetical protein